MNDKVIVTSMVSGIVGITMPNSRVKKIWPKKGTKLPVEKDLLREAIYEPGVEYMFKNGILYIDDMDFKVELGLESEGTQTPTQIIPVDEKYLNRVLRLMPISEMKAAVNKMSDNQKKELLDYTVEQNDIQLDRLRVLSELTDVDLLQVINLKKQKEE